MLKCTTVLPVFLNKVKKKNISCVMTRSFGTMRFKQYQLLMNVFPIPEASHNAVRHRQPTENGNKKRVSNCQTKCHPSLPRPNSYPFIILSVRMEIQAPRRWCLHRPPFSSLSRSTKHYAGVIVDYSIPRKLDNLLAGAPTSARQRPRR